MCASPQNGCSDGGCLTPKASLPWEEPGAELCSFPPRGDRLERAAAARQNLKAKTATLQQQLPYHPQERKRRIKATTARARPFYTTTKSSRTEPSHLRYLSLRAGKMAARGPAPTRWSASALATAPPEACVEDTAQGWLVGTRQQRLANQHCPTAEVLDGQTSHGSC